MTNEDYTNLWKENAALRAIITGQAERLIKAEEHFKKQALRIRELEALLQADKMGEPL